MGKQAKLGTFASESAEEATKDEKIQGPYDLPEGWRWVKIKNIAKTISGGTPRRSVKEYWEDGTIPWVKSGELEDNIIHQTEEKITEKALRCSNVKLIPKGTLLVAMYGATVGKTAILGIDATINQAICAIFPNFTVVERDYLRYYFIYKRKELIIRSFGGAQPNISQVVIKNMVVPLPPLEEQKRIVSRLEQLVNRAEEAKRLRKQAREEAEKIMQAALNKVFSRAEEEGWKYVKLSDITEISAGGTPKRSVKEYWNGNIPWVKILDIPEDGLVLDTQEKITEEGLKNSSAKIFPKGTILFSIFATIAKVGILGINAATNQAIAAIQIKDTKIVEQKYLFYCLKNFGTSLLTIGRGMAQRNINQTILRNLKIPLPAPEDQKRIVAYLEKISEITKSLEKLQRKTEEELEKLVPSILDKAFKGGL